MVKSSVLINFPFLLLALYEKFPRFSNAWLFGIQCPAVLALSIMLFTLSVSLFTSFEPYPFDFITLFVCFFCPIRNHLIRYWAAQSHLRCSVSRLIDAAHFVCFWRYSYFSLILYFTPILAWLSIISNIRLMYLAKQVRWWDIGPELGSIGPIWHLIGQEPSDGTIPALDEYFSVTKDGLEVREEYSSCDEIASGGRHQIVLSLRRNLALFLIFWIFKENSLILFFFLLLS